MASISHLNGLATRFGDELVVVGISDEQRDDFEKGVERRRLGPSSFKYALALDPDARMKKALAIRGIPHAIVMSSDWVVRWQGHPAALDGATLEQIIRADASSGTSPAASRGRWRSGLR